MVKNYFLFFAVTFFLLDSTVQSQTYTINTVAGTGTQGHSGDGGLAINAELNYCTSTAADLAGNLYIAEQGANCIRKVNTAGIISTFAGTGIAGYSGDGGQAINAQFNLVNGLVVDTVSNSLFVIDWLNNRIRKIDLTSNIITTYVGNGSAGSVYEGIPANSTTILFPQTICCDAFGNLYIAISGDFKIFKVAKNTGIITAFAGNGTANNTGNGGLATSASVYQVNSIVADGVGNLYMSIADQSNHIVRKINSAGIISAYAGIGTSGFSGDGGSAMLASFNVPNGLCIDYQGNLIVYDSYNYRCRKIDKTTEIIHTIAGNGTAGNGGDGGMATSAQLSLWLNSNPSGTKFYMTGFNKVREFKTEIINSLNGYDFTPDDVVVYPNPSSGIYSLKFSLSEQLEYKDIQVENSVGQIVFLASPNKIFSQHSEIILDLSIYSKGVYILKMNTNKGVVNKKIVKN